MDRNQTPAHEEMIPPGIQPDEKFRLDGMLQIACAGAAMGRYVDQENVCWAGHPKVYANLLDR